MEHKLKNTRQRAAIIDIIKNSRIPLSADEIYAELIEKGCRVSMATVYRTLDVLTENNVLNRVSLKQGKTSYEINEGSHHHYLICVNCDEAIKVDVCPMLHTFESQVKEKTDFNIVGHKLEIYGYCSKCSK